MGLSSTEVAALFADHVIANYKRYPVCLVRGEGSWVWDAEGQRYLDFFPGWGCNLLGHCPPRVVAAVREQVGQLIHVPNTWYMEAQGQFAAALGRISFGGQVFFCNSGTEANEAALKLARLRGHDQGRYKIISTHHSFHGRTFGSLTATGQPKYHAGLGPLLPGVSYVPFGDADAVAAQVDSETAAIIVEPIQGEGGVNVPPPGYLRALRDLADRHGLVLIFDEVQTGMGRTGRWFAHQHEGVVPDLMTLSKSLAGGVACGALVARRELAPFLKPGTHAATFGGNPLACRAGLAFIETVEQEGLLDRAAYLERLFRDRLSELQARQPPIKVLR
ncbi:MAG TPA: aminotransferase class III-fold pyridoxal phosphate-dependent enzyme, partial [Gemmatales bacterium]|nr:aminotransferase class III-fold pyridoxal phosphate-dependent enzyme [Gemmatales bacterium]